MWCSACQQDVPAVAQSPQSQLVCSRCRQALDNTVRGSILDSGIDLASFDDPADAPIAEQQPKQKLEEEASRLRRIGRQLRSSNQKSDVSLSPLLSSPFGNSTHSSINRVEDQLQTLSHREAHGARIRKPSTKPSMVSLLLWTGTAALLIGIGELTWSVVHKHPKLWQIGMTTTMAAEAALVFALTWMSVQLWKNGRHVNQQLRGVTGQLHDIEQFTGSLSGTHLSSSQHYYHRFNQVANPHLLIANLRGQVDQLASRIGGNCVE